MNIKIIAVIQQIENVNYVLQKFLNVILAKIYHNLYVHHAIMVTT